MSAQESKETDDEQDTKSEDEQDTDDDVPTEPSEEGKEEVKKMAAAYEDQKTAVMPGTDRTITGTAVNQWLDDDGNPKFGDPDEQPFAKEDSDDDSSEEDSD